MKSVIYNQMTANAANQKKAFAVLIDPDKQDVAALKTICSEATKHAIDYFFVGGSLLTINNFEQTISFLKDYSSVPVVIFPGNTLQISANADAIMFLSLISGRNPEMLIGKHVVVAPFLKSSGIEVISTGYMLIDSGKPTTALYMSNSHPIPYDKPDIALCTAMAGEMLGLKLIYMDAGSGAQKAISQQMISKVKENIDIPLITGGGISTEEQAKTNWDAGADIVVIGNAIEKDPSLIGSVAALRF